MPDPQLDLEALVLAWRDGALSDDQFAELQQHLLADPDARAAFVANLHRHRQIDRVLNKQSDTTEVEPSPAPPAPPTGMPRFSGAWIPPAYKLAATLLLTAAALAIYAFTSAPPAVPGPSAPTPVATVIESTGTLLIDDDIARAGAEYASGVYALDRGDAECLLTNRVTVNLLGPTRLVVHSPMRATLERGSARFHCPPGTEGFTVTLPDGSRVVDLGTAFRTTIDDDGRARVLVSSGNVEVRRADAVHPVRAGQVAFIERGVVTTHALRLVDDFAIAFDNDSATPIRWTEPWRRSGEVRLHDGSGVAFIRHGYTERRYDWPALPADQPVYLRVDMRDLGGSDGTSMPARVHVIGDGFDPTNTLGFGLHFGQARLQLDGQMHLIGSDLADGRWHTLIVRILFNAEDDRERVTLWVDPTAPETADLTSDVAVDLKIDTLGEGVRLWQYPYERSAGVEYDNLRIATTWDAVASDPAPETENPAADAPSAPESHQGDTP